MVTLLLSLAWAGDPPPPADVTLAADELLEEAPAAPEPPPPMLRYVLGKSTQEADRITAAPMGRRVPLSPQADGNFLTGVVLTYPVDQCPGGPNFKKAGDFCNYQLDYTPSPDGGGTVTLGKPLNSFFGQSTDAGHLSELGVRSKDSWRAQDSWLCVYSSPAAASPMPSPHCPQKAGMQVEEHYLKLTDASRKGWFSLGLSLVLVVAGNLLIQGRHLRGLDIATLLGRLFLSSAYYTTVANTLNLARLQVVLWTQVVLFGFLYVWNTSESELSLTSDVLVLMGIGAGTALGARSADRGGGEDRYYLLVKNRKPKLRDLVTIGGRADVFKLQMLLFTLVSVWMVLQELVYSGTFPTLSSELLGLMGISSATYLGNEALGGTQTEVMAAMKKLEEACKEAGLSIDTDPELRALGERTDFQGNLEEKVLQARENLKKLLIV